MTVAERFVEIAKKNASQPALAYLAGGQYQIISYGELESCRKQLAAIFSERQWSAGERVAIMLANGPEWIISDLAAATIGLVVVPIHSTYNAEFVVKVVRHSEAKYLIIQQDFLEKYQSTINNLGLSSLLVVGAGDNGDRKDIWSWPKFSAGQERVEGKVGVQADDIHTVIYTSGTTGDPKGVMLSHKNIISNVDAAKRAIEI